MSVHGTSTQGLFLPSFSPSCSHPVQSGHSHKNSDTSHSGVWQAFMNTSVIFTPRFCKVWSQIKGHRHPCGLPPSLTLFTTVLMIQCTVFKKRRHLTYQNSSWCLWETGQNYYPGKRPTQSRPVTLKGPPSLFSMRFHWLTPTQRTGFPEHLDPTHLLTNPHWLTYCLSPVPGNFTNAPISLSTP